MARSFSRQRRRVHVAVLGLGILCGLVWGVAVARFTVPSAALILVALGGGALAFCALTLFRILEPLLLPETAIGDEDIEAMPVRRRELEREKQLVLKAIREIEHDFQMRKISQADHDEMTARYRARALRLLAELESAETGGYRTLIEDELRARLERTT